MQLISLWELTLFWFEHDVKLNTIIYSTLQILNTNNFVDFRSNCAVWALIDIDPVRSIETNQGVLILRENQCLLLADIPNICTSRNPLVKDLPEDQGLPCMRKGLIIVLSQFRKPTLHLNPLEVRDPPENQSLHCMRADQHIVLSQLKKSTDHLNLKMNIYPVIKKDLYLCNHTFPVMIQIQIERKKIQNPK